MYYSALQVSNARKYDGPVHLASVQALHHSEYSTRSQQSSPSSARALLTPFLAHNLGLEYHAAPFYSHVSVQDENTAQQTGSLARQPSCGIVRLSKWQGSIRRGPSPARLPVADAVWVSSVRQPDASLLHSQLGAEQVAAAAAEQPPNGSNTQQQQQQQHGKLQVDDSLDNALVAALQSYFKQHPRCAMARRVLHGGPAHTC